MAIATDNRATNGKLRPYPEYRDSGVLWLGKVPAHWHLLRLRYVLREIDRRTSTGTETLLSLTKEKGLVPQSLRSNRVLNPSNLIGYKICEPDQIVMNRMQAWNGMFGRASKNGLVSPDYAVFDTVESIDSRFIENLLRTPGIVSEFAAESRGVGTGFMRLYTDRLGAVLAPIPAEPEQAMIARYLDHQDRRISRLIQAKRRLIALLTEQKQAIIHRAVTRGLDPDAPLKPSGVDWLGDVPAHWEVKRIKHLYGLRLITDVSSGARGATSGSGCGS